MSATTKPCPNCEGAGETEIRMSAAGATDYDVRILCRKCDGYGYLIRLEGRWYPHYRGAA